MDRPPAERRLSRRRLFLVLGQRLLAFVCERVKIAARRLQKALTHEIVHGVEHLCSPRGFISRRFEHHVQVQSIALHVAKDSENFS